MKQKQEKLTEGQERGREKVDREREIKQTDGEASHVTQRINQNNSVPDVGKTHI